MSYVSKTITSNTGNIKKNIIQMSSCYMSYVSKTITSNTGNIKKYNTDVVMLYVLCL